MTYKERIEADRRAWIGREVIFEGEKHKVVDVDYNGALMIDRPTKHNPTTAIEAWKIKDGVYTNPTYTLETPDGDKWDFDTEEEARRNKYLFGGSIKCHL